MIYKAAKRVRIKLATAKVILSNYRKFGKIFHRKDEEVSASEELSEERQEGAENIEGDPQQPDTMTTSQAFWVFYYFPIQNYHF